jgi:DNA (cytosine-5)-methyltransferase 1
LAALGFNAKWGVLGAVDAGAPHKRDRIWIVATNTKREPLRNEAGGNMEPRESKREIVGCDGTSCNVANSNGIFAQAGNESAGPHEVRYSGERTLSGSKKVLADSDCEHEQRKLTEIAHAQERQEQEERSARSCRHGGEWWATEPAVGRVVNGVAARVDRLKALGNGQVPAVAKLAWEILTSTK